MSADETQLIQRCINTIRFLSIDAIEKANSGHPGLPMGTAPIAYTLWMKHLKHNPVNPQWINRDRFVLSAGHGSMLLYAMLYLTGYNITLDDIMEFRQWNSKTPGHPEYGITPGVEVTTGPLGQGLSNAVGMAIAEAHLAAVYNRSGYLPVDHYVYVLASDGDLMEGVASEACSLAGHLGLGKLIVFFDDNNISLAGSTRLTFTEDTGKRFEAYGWHVQHVEDGNDVEGIDQAIEKAKREKSRPSLISVATTIGYGSPSKQGSYKVHGSPLGQEEVAAAKKNLKWPVEPQFFIPQDVSKHMQSSREKGQEIEACWNVEFEKYCEAYPNLATKYKRVMEGRLPEDWEACLPAFGNNQKDISTRKASEEVLQKLASSLPELVGGTADLNPSTLAWVKGCGDCENPAIADSASKIQGCVGDAWGYEGRNIHFGVREHAMGSIANGMALHGGIIPFTGTFFTFSDYMRPPIRLAALMGIHVIYVFSHDSIGVGEDGPTHQPVEQLMNLRSVPELTVIRPGDASEVVEAWKWSLLHKEGPTALVFTRQNIPVIDRTVCSSAEGLHRGGYVLWETNNRTPEIIIIGTGSELSMALAAGKKLSEEDIAVRVVSLPCWEIFDKQSASYRESVFPDRVRCRIAVEAGQKLGWEHYLGLEGIAIGMGSFGASAPATVLYDKFGITIENVIKTARELLHK